MQTPPLKYRRSLAAALLASLCSACALTTPPAADELYRQALPSAPLPAGWQGAQRADVVVPGWLASLNDPQLSALVSEALANNPDLKAVGSRVEQAAAYAKVAGASLMPQVNFIAKDGLAQSGGDGSGISVVGLFVSWELDLWGRVRGGQEFAVQQYASAQADAEYARQSLAALVSKNYLLAIEAGQQKKLALQMQQSSEALFQLSKDNQRIGKGDEYAVVQAEASLQSYLDAVQQLTLAETQAVRALEVALGRYPGQSLKLPDALPQATGDIPAGLPSELLERRPDVIAAQRRVAAAFARVDEAKAARLPRLSLTANINNLSSDVFLLQDRDNPVWGLGASLLAPIYAGGALQGQVEVRTAEQKVAVAEYAKVGSRAFAEVENALSGEITARKRSSILSRNATQNVRMLELAKVRVKVGSGDVRAQQQQQISTYAAQSGLLRMQSEALVQRVNAYLALGGGFDTPPATVAASNP